MIRCITAKLTANVVNQRISVNLAIISSMAPWGVGPPPIQNQDNPPRRLSSSTFHSFETPQEPKMLRALKDFPWLRLHATTGSHLHDTSKHFSFLKSSSISLFWAKKAKK